jgi:two-component system, sensor histidine kinase
MGRAERRVLIVDDSPEDRESVRRYLREDQEFDYQFLEDSTGLDGLRTCRTSGIDCLLLDYDLPDLDGLEFLAELTGGSDRSPVPLVMLTGRGGESAAVQALKRGAHDYLVKGSYSPEVLRRTVEDAIERVSIGREIERQRRELEQLHEEVRESDNRKDEFLAMLAHELRNPLAPILNAVQVMKLRPDDRAAHGRMCEVVEQQVHHLRRLVDDLLDVSRIARGKIQLQPRRIDLASVVTLAAENARPSIERRRQELTLKLPHVPVSLEADPTRIEQVVVNLLGNASKYTDPGGTIVMEVAREGDGVTISVRDNGIGISAEMLPKVFDLFAQSDQSLERSQGGLGLGLTLVRSLVQLHGGSVDVNSEGLGLGSEFLVRLPASGDAGLPEIAAIAAEDSSRGGSLKVLIVDDNVHAAESLALVVKLWDHDARVVHDGPGAIAMAEDYRPHVVLLDIGLPGMDGYSVAGKLRARPEFREILMIAMTGYGRDEDFRRSTSVGFDRHLVKPIDFDELQALLSEVGSTG